MDSAAEIDVKDVVDFLPPDAVAYLRFAEGDARFPVHPIPSGDFLVGSGADCDLRLGDGVLPPLHSVVRATASSASWTRLVRSPELFVNGESVRQAHLHDGDLVEIGPFRLVFRFGAEQAEAALSQLLALDATARSERLSPAAMPAHQLVEALEQELQLLDGWERTAQTGLAELLDSVSALSRRLQVVAPEQAIGTQADAACRDSAAAAVSQADVQQLLQQQYERLEMLSEVLERVIRQQRVMTDVLHGMSQRLSQMSVQPLPRRRAS